MYMPYYFEEGILAENVLMFLKKFEGLPFTVRELCLFAKRSRPAVWKTLKSLEKKGLIELRKDGRKYRGKVARRKRYYQVPSYYLSELLTPEERYVYCYLQSLSGKREIWISMRETARRLRISRNTLSRVLKSLAGKYVLDYNPTKRGTRIKFLYYQQTAKLYRGQKEMDGEILPTRHFNLKEKIETGQDRKRTVEVAETTYDFPHVRDEYLMNAIREGKISLLGARYFDFYASFVYYLALGWADAVTDLLTLSPAKAPTRISEVENVKYLVAMVDKLSQIAAPHDLKVIDLMALVFAARKFFLQNPVEWSYLASGFFKTAAKEILRNAVVETAKKRDLPVYTEVDLSRNGEVVFKEKKGPFIEREEREYPGRVTRIVIGEPVVRKTDLPIEDGEYRKLCYLSAKLLNQISELTKETPLDRKHPKPMTEVIARVYGEAKKLNCELEAALADVERLKQAKEEAPELACYVDYPLREAEAKVEALLNKRERIKKDLTAMVRKTYRWLKEERKKREKARKEKEKGEQVEEKN